MRITESVRNLLAKQNYMLVRYGYSDERSRRMRQVSRVAQERTLLLNHAEACQIMSAVRAVAHVPGDIAELGVFAGASARLIADHMQDGKTLHLFDTFEGLPAVGEVDSKRFTAGEFSSTFESARDYLKNAPAVRFHNGLFPGTAAAVSDHRFSFVHLDVDIYSSTLAGLEFFYPRMSRGGILITHDYMSADGVTAAFREFFTGKPEPVIELTGYQALVVKL
ncbi:MAG TPA: TylF/MycF/NovP-related O-methyltransferase [Bryobacteraceae bacterium]|nr:TylF/MycF/NovP-related O-methyltransferase [Bryobacteraceae bacterium]